MGFFLEFSSPQINQRITLRDNFFCRKLNALQKNVFFNNFSINRRALKLFTIFLAVSVFCFQTDINLPILETDDHV